MTHIPPMIISKKHKSYMPVDDFVGRKTEINMILESLRKHSNNLRWCWRGQNRISVSLAKQLQQEFLDGQLMIDLTSTVPEVPTVYEAMAAVVHTFDPTALLPANLDDLQSRYYTLLQGKRRLIDVDQPAVDEDLTVLIPPPDSKLLITSRR